MASSRPALMASSLSLSPLAVLRWPRSPRACTLVVSSPGCLIADGLGGGWFREVVGVDGPGPRVDVEAFVERGDGSEICGGDGEGAMENERAWWIRCGRGGVGGSEDFRGGDGEGEGAREVAGVTGFESSSSSAIGEKVRDENSGGERFDDDGLIELVDARRFASSDGGDGVDVTDAARGRGVDAAMALSRREADGEGVMVGRGGGGCGGDESTSIIRLSTPAPAILSVPSNRDVVAGGSSSCASGSATTTSTGGVGTGGETAGKVGSSDSALRYIVRSRGGRARGAARDLPRNDLGSVGATGSSLRCLRCASNGSTSGSGLRSAYASTRLVTSSSPFSRSPTPPRTF